MGAVLCAGMLVGLAGSMSVTAQLLKNRKYQCRYMGKRR